MTGRKGSAGQESGGEMINTFPLQDKESDISLLHVCVKNFPHHYHCDRKCNELVKKAIENQRSITENEFQVGRYPAEGLKAMRIYHRTHHNATLLHLVNGVWVLEPVRKCAP